MIHNKFFLLFFTFFIISLLTFCQSSQKVVKSEFSVKKKYLLTNDSIKFWDGSQGYGFMISINDSSVIEYGYDEIGRRVKASYANDVAEFKLKWKVDFDTLYFILPTNRNYQKNAMLFLSKDSLKMVNLIPYQQKEKTYIKALDQKMFPIEGTATPSDTSKWIIKFKTRDQ